MESMADHLNPQDSFEVAQLSSQIVKRGAPSAACHVIQFRAHSALIDGYRDGARPTWPFSKPVGDSQEAEHGR
jgi:hypothetical protein